MSSPDKNRRFVFLDRDGVINRDSPLYIKGWEEFDFLPRSIAAIRQLNANGFKIIVITNQSAIGRRFITTDTLQDMHRRMLGQIRQNGGNVLDIFYCPHRPEDNCDCRKPRPGLIRKACRKHTIRAEESIMVGDSAKDIECARNAGCAAAVLVKTGNGIAAKAELDRRNVTIDYVAEDLYGAVEWIINMQNPKSSSPTTLEGCLERITYYNPEDHFVIARFQPAGGGRPITILGHMPEPGVGESLSISGSWRKHPRYGQQFMVDGYRIVLPSDVDGVRTYLESGLIKGVGPATVARLVEHFKEKTLDVIENQPELLESVRGIGPATAKRIALSWKVHHGLKQLMDFLQDNGLKAAYGAKLYKLYGNRALEILRDDPWQLAEDLPRIGFTIADTLMQKSGVAVDDIDRVKACILHLLYLDAEDGSVCMSEEALCAQNGKRFRIDPRDSKTALDHLLAEHKIVVEPDPVLAGDRIIYLAALHQAESGISGKLTALIDHAVEPIRIEPAVIEKTVLRHLAIKLSDEQMAVLRDIMAHRIALITGGPGTGKTTLIRSITAVFANLRKKVYLCAPTGRAARRLAELTGKPAATIHRMLGFNPTEAEFDKNRDNPLQADVIIVDEASMVDTMLMHHLINAVHLDSRIILVGDVFQLPAVGPGNVLADLIACRRIKTYELTTVFRQAQQSPIVINAHRIRQGQLPVLPDPGEDLSDFYFSACHNPDQVVRRIVDLCSRHIPERFGFDPINDIQVLVPMHKGVVGTYNLNQRLQEGLNPGPTLIRNQGRNFKTGDKVMHLQNNYAKEVFNGDSGIIIEIDSRNTIVSVDYDGRIIDYEAAELDEIALAYAITVHKSQGSEYPAVIIPLLTQHYALLQRNLLYTAVTRGKRLVIIIGTEKAYSIALENDRPHQRLSGLKYRLNAELSETDG